MQASPRIDGEGASKNTNPYWPIATATLTTPVFDVVHMFSERSISAVPIIDEDGIVVNLYETVDVIVRFRKYFSCARCSPAPRHWCDLEHTNPSILQYLKHSTNVPLTSQVLLSALQMTLSASFWNS